MDARYSEFDDVVVRGPGLVSSKKAGDAIYKLARRHTLSVTELSRYSEYSGVVNGHPLTVSVFDRDPVADLQALRSAVAERESDLEWENWLARVESESGRDIPNLDSAYIAHRNGVTASDYALEVVARAAEMAGV
jgi:hypothetical protein